jgi:hypothetical protein
MGIPGGVSLAGLSTFTQGITTPYPNLWWPSRGPNEVLLVNTAPKRVLAINPSNQGHLWRSRQSPKHLLTPNAAAATCNPTAVEYAINTHCHTSLRRPRHPSNDPFNGSTAATSSHQIAKNHHCSQLQPQDNPPQWSKRCQSCRRPESTCQQSPQSTHYSWLAQLSQRPHHKPQAVSALPPQPSQYQRCCRPRPPQCPQHQVQLLMLVI